MGVKFFCKNQLILAISNSSFDSLHKRILHIIERDKIEIDENVKIFLHKTDQDIYGDGLVGSDIGKYLKTKKDVLQFSVLARQAIEEEQQTEYPYRQDVYEHLIDFCNELLKYAETLKE